MGMLLTIITPIKARDGVKLDMCSQYISGIRTESGVIGHGKARWWALSVFKMFVMLVKFGLAALRLIEA